MLSKFFKRSLREQHNIQLIKKIVLNLCYNIMKMKLVKSTRSYGMVRWLIVVANILNFGVYFVRKSILYRRLYRFGHRYDIFQISVNIDIPFLVYRYFIYFIYIYTHKKKKKRRKGKIVNDIVSTTRIMSTKLTFRATLPF